MKPDFNDLPWSIQERLLWEMELDYNNYESSKAETIHEISNGYVYSPNDLIIKNYYKAISEDFLLTIINQELEENERRQTNLQMCRAKLLGEIP
jgi:hypothetical protein